MISARRARAVAGGLFLLAAGVAAAQQEATTLPHRAGPGPGPGPVGPPPPPRVVWVSGEGRVAVAPDVAIVTLGVEAVGKSVAATTADAAARMKAILDALARHGVAGRDVRTTRYDVSAERPWKDGKPGPVTGYRVTNAAEARVRDLGKLGAVLDAATTAGSNQVGGLRMDRDDPAPQRAQALAAAYADARRKAEALAAAAHVTLGEPLSIREEGAGRPGPVLSMARMAMATEAAPVPMAEGELEVVARVDVAFGIR